MTSMGPIIQIGKNREILTVLLDILQGLAADVVRAGLLREECLGIKAQVIPDGRIRRGRFAGAAAKARGAPLFRNGRARDKPAP